MPQRRSILEAIARRRVALGFLSGALVLWLAQPTLSSLTAGTAVAIVGESLRVWAAGHLNKAREVTTSGPYRWIAHPLYVGSSIMGAGVALMANSVAVTIIIGLYLGITLSAAIANEEAFLRRTFGERYDRYRLGGGDSRIDGEADRPFRLSQALANREHRALVGLAAAVLLLALKATYNGRP